MKLSTNQYQQAKEYLKGKLPLKDIAQLIRIPLEKLLEIKEGKALAEINNLEFIPSKKRGRPKKGLDLSRLKDAQYQKRKYEAKKLAA